MEKLQIGKNYQIHSYKHNGKIHKVWDEAIFIEENKEFLIFGNNKTRITRADGKSWKSKGPSIIFFYKKHWFSVIAQIKSYGIQYKCDIASPYVIEGDTLKYIDYDLDLKIFTTGETKVLDQREYEYHKLKMKYPDKLDMILKKELQILIEKAQKKDKPFGWDYVMYYYNKYIEINTNSKKGIKRTETSN